MADYMRVVGKHGFGDTNQTPYMHVMSLSNGILHLVATKERVSHNSIKLRHTGDGFEFRFGIRKNLERSIVHVCKRIKNTCEIEQIQDGFNIYVTVDSKILESTVSLIDSNQPPIYIPVKNDIDVIPAKVPDNVCTISKKYLIESIKEYEVQKKYNLNFSGIYNIPGTNIVIN